MVYRASDIYQYVAHLPRQVPHALPVRSFGFQPAKPDWIHRRFEFLAFSFVVHGTGVLRAAGREWTVSGPCVLRQEPGGFYRYGPDHEWEEFYVTYEPAAQDQLTHTAWAAVDSPMIILSDSDLLRRHCQRLLGTCEHLSQFGGADRIDQLFEELLLEVLVANRRPAGGGLDDRLQRARQWIEEHSTDQMSFEEVAARHGMSGRTFRRHWGDRFGVTPGAYLTSIRMRQACSLLAGTHLPIAEISAQTGFNDPHYFSRRFRKEIGKTPLAFRREAGDNRDLRG
jgi:AraC-like DNA-binding protein